MSINTLFLSRSKKDSFILYVVVLKKTSEIVHVTLMAKSALFNLRTFGLKEMKKEGETLLKSKLSMHFNESVFFFLFFFGFFFVKIFFPFFFISRNFFF